MAKIHLLVALASVAAACSLPPSAPSAAGAGPAVSVDAKAGVNPNPATTYAQSFFVFGNGVGDAGGIRNYAVGATVTVSTSAGPQTLIASGSHAKVTARIPAGDTSVHVVAAYPGWCANADYVVPVKGGLVVHLTRC